METTRDSVLGFRLRRHHLTRRLGSGAIPEVAAVAGLRNSPPGTAAEALLARLTRLPADPFESLVEVLGPRLVGTYVPIEDVAVFTVGAMPADERALREMLGDRTAKALAADGIGLAEAVRRISDAAREELAGGPRTRGALSAALTRRLPDSMSGWCERCGATHVSDTLFRTPGGSGVLRVAPRTGREVVLAALDLPDTDPEAARLELTRRFLRAYGPATPEDFAGWTNTGPTEARRRWAVLADELTDVTVGGRTAQLLRADASALARATRPGGVRLLPAGDPHLLARDRATLVPDAAGRKRLWPALAAPGAVLVDGELVATWRARRRKDVLELDLTPFGPPPSPAAVEPGARLLATHRGCADVAVRVG
ncbi:MAG TPA: crosslink repair DNA glycosylase YcaQ family protein [Mycobacteriales bacterium]